MGKGFAVPFSSDAVCGGVGDVRGSSSSGVGEGGNFVCLSYGSPKDMVVSLGGWSRVLRCVGGGLALVCLAKLLAVDVAGMGTRPGIITRHKR